MSLIFVWVLLVLISLWAFYTPSLEAQKNYQLLMYGENQLEKDSSQVDGLPTQQTRYQVSKQIFYKKDSQRMQSRLTSEYSDLFFESKKNGAELVEHFKELTCTMQEELIENDLLPEQYFRCLKAKEATYSYKSGQLEAVEVEITRYLLPTHRWPSTIDSFSPLLQGQAQKIQLSFLKEPLLKAQGFQAIFHHEEGG